MYIFFLYDGPRGIGGSIRKDAKVFGEWDIFFIMKNEWNLGKRRPETEAVGRESLQIKHTFIQ